MDKGYILAPFKGEDILNAIEKQLKPKKPIRQIAKEKIKIGNGYFGKGVKIYSCPSCGGWTSKIYKHCYHCGQLLDWEVKNEG